MIPFPPFETVLDTVAASDKPRPPATMPLAPGWAMFLDLDGTLCPYEVDPAQVALNRRQHALLEALSHRLDGALCVLSGRQSADLDRALGALAIPRCGEHGHAIAAPASAALCAVLEEVEARMRALAEPHHAAGMWVERKPASCALHYRQCPWLAECTVEKVRDIASDLFDVRLLEGKSVLEFVPRGADKGSALRAFMGEATFRDRVPVAVGDDVTDEDAFIAASALGGFGVAVGSRPSQAARYQLSDCFAVNAWLEQLEVALPDQRHV